MEDRDVEELQRIWELKEKGAISDEEYSRLKARILGHQKETAEPNEKNEAPRPTSAVRVGVPPQETKPNYSKRVGIGCVALSALIVVLAIIGSATQSGNSTANQSAQASNENIATTDTNATEDTANHTAAPEDSPWSYSQDEDKVRGGTTYYASTTSTNSIAQDPPYDSDTKMTITVRKSPAYGTDVILTISSGQMMCPSYEGCSGTVRFDDGRPEHVSFNGPADEDSESVFVVGAKQFISKLKSAKRVTIEKTLYQAGNPQFEFDVHGLKWDH
ncbi:MAG TPA: SHOCT domain-containing protein [Sphingomicrobium sp.]|nr:SHOCT domain-containing protein [Sphingomicrobium sp.]